MFQLKSFTFTLLKICEYLFEKDEKNLCNLLNCNTFYAPGNRRRTKSLKTTVQNVLTKL